MAMFVKSQELSNGRLAMMATIGMCVQAPKGSSPRAFNHFKHWFSLNQSFGTEFRPEI